jgi:hypothetical protein
VGAAYLAVIMLRELRGGVHIDAVTEVGLTPLQACYLQDEMIFKLHGYVDDEAPEVTPDLEEKKDVAERITNASMARVFATLSDDERTLVATVTRSMAEALADPVPARE